MIVFVSFALILSVGFCGASECGRRQWPPSDPQSLKDPVTGTFDLRINPHVAPLAFVHNSLCDYAAYFQKKNNIKVEGDCLMQTAKARPNFNEEAWDYFPQPIDNAQIVDAVKAGNAVYEAPQYDSRLTLLTEPNTCKQGHDIVIMMASCVQCSAGREKSRSTFLNPKLWSNVKVGWVFVTGIPSREPVKKFYFPGMTVENKDFFPEGTDKTALFTQLLDEASKYDDIVVGDYEEDGYHQVWTYITAIRWASAFCYKKVPIFAYIDGHISLIPPNFVNWLNNVPASMKPRYFGGQVYHGFAVNHDSGNKWSTPYEELPWPSYPPIVDAYFNILGHDTVVESAILSAFTRYNRNPSAFISIVNRRSKINPSNIYGVKAELTSREDAKYAIVGTTSSTDKFINWDTGNVK